MLKQNILRHLNRSSARLSSSKVNSDNIVPTLENRNPRNLEKMRIAYKPDGYHLEKPGRSYWHTLKLVQSSRHVSAQVVHYLNGPVISASTSEWALKKQLYRTTDTSAYINLARVLAARCLQSGITEMVCSINADKGSKAESFLKEVQDGGICLEEPERFKAAQPWDLLRPEKPWEVTE